MFSFSVDYRASRKIVHTAVLLVFLAGFLIPQSSAYAASSLTVTPITWNVVGLDSNNVNVGPNRFPMGVRACNPSANAVSFTDVEADFVWLAGGTQSDDSYIRLRPGSLDPIQPATQVDLDPNECFDFYFELEIERDPISYDETRRYRIDVTYDDPDISGIQSVSTTTPREIYVEHIVSQSRNATTDVLLDGVSIPSGGGMTLLIGETYDIELIGSTATNGYEQIETFINFPNTIFQILSVDTTYSADTSSNVTSPDDKLYGNGCTWENDPNSPNYRACLGVGKAGGNITVTYQVKIIGGAGTSQSLSTLIYDFSGSSYHYNSDFGVSTRIANIVDPSSITISKNFNPDPTSAGGVSTLTFTLTNPTSGTISGLNFTDTLPTAPGAMVVAGTPNASTTNCGSPTFSPTAGATSLSFSDGTLAPNSSCLISVNVTVPAVGTYTNTSNHLFVDLLDTGNFATDPLTVNNAPAPPAPLCGLSLATWAFPSGFSTTSPAASTSSVTASAKPGDGVVSTSFSEGTNSWGSNGSITTGTTLVSANEEYFEFAIDAAGYSTVYLTFDAARKNTPNSPQGIAIYYGTTSLTTDGTAGNGAATDPGTAIYAANSTALPTGTTAFTSFGGGSSISFTPGSGTSYIRIYGFNSGNTSSGSDVFFDNVSFTGCSIPNPPTITKAFSPNPIAENGTSVLTFTLANSNSVALTGAAFTDSLPSGLQVGNPTGYTTTCGFTATTPLTNDTSLSFSGGTIPASSSCMASVNVTGATAGVYQNVSGFVSSTNGGTNTGSSGSATASLTILEAPSIAKLFAPNPILAGGTSTLTFTITNPNQNDSLTGLAFTDTFPVSPGAMTVATPLATSNSCGGSLQDNSGGALGTGDPGIRLTGGTLAGGSSCTVTVNVTAPATGSYSNTSGAVSSTNAGTGNTASDILTVNAPNPAIAILKQVGPSATGPWSSFLAVTTGADVYYQFTVENTGDVPLNSVSISDPALPSAATTCNSTWTDPLPVAVAANENHIDTCVVGPVTASSGSHSNTATASGTYNSTTVSDTSTAVYATTGLTIAKSVTEGYFTAAGNVLNYGFVVTNSGSAPLAGPVTVSDDKAIDESCPAVNTVGDLDGFLDVGESVTCAATYTVQATDVTAGSVTNAAFATVSGVQSNTDDETVYLAALTIDKDTTTAAVSPNGIVTYSIVVVNTGGVGLTNFQVTDAVPFAVGEYSITNVAASVTSGSLTANFPGYDGSGTTTLLAGTDTLVAGATATITITLQLNNAALATYDNTATASSVQTGSVDDDGMVANDSGTPVGPATDPETDEDVTVTNSFGTLIIVKDAVPNDAQDFAYTVSGSGPSPFVLDDDAGSDPTYVNTQTFNNLVAGGTYGVTETAVSGWDVTNIICTGATSSTVTIGSDNDFDAGDADVSVVLASGETVTCTFTNSALPAITVTKTANDTSIPETGQSVVYTIAVENTSLVNVVLDDLTDDQFNDITTTGHDGITATTCVTGGTILAGNNFSCTFTATVFGDFPGSHVNVVTAQVSNGGNSVSDTDDETVTFEDVLPNVTITKTANDNSVPETGQSVTFTFTVTNNSSEAATITALSDSDFAITGDADCQAGTVLAAGANCDFTHTATISGDFGGADHVNTASVTVTDDDGNTDTDTEDETVTFEDVLPNITITKAADDNSIPETGQSITFTFTVTNNGDEAGTITALSDSDFSISGDADCQIGTVLASGVSCDFTHVTTISGDFSGADHVNTASVTVTDDDGTTDTDTEDETVAFEDVLPDVSIVKTANDNSVPESGQSVTFTFTVTNNSGESGSITALSDSDFSITGDADCQIGTALAAGASCDFTHTATISGDFGGADHVNTASVTISDNEGNVDTDTDDETVSFENVLPSVSIVKTANDNSIPETGQSVTFTFTVTNNSSESATITALADSDFPITGDTDCQVGTVLAFGASCDFTHTATISGDFGGADHVNTASVTVSDDDSNTASDTDDETVSFEDVLPDITIVKTANDNSVPETGQSVTFTFTVTNNGGESATITALSDSDFAITGDADCQIGTVLAAGASCDFTHTATISGDFGGADHVNTASVTVSDDDSNTDSDTDDETVTFEDVLPDIAVTKTANPLSVPESGGPVTYTVVVTNNGAESVVLNNLTDDQFNNVTTTGHDGITATTCTTGGAIVSGGNYTCTFTATVSGVAGVDHVNVVTAQVSDDDGNTDTATDDATVSFTGTSIISDYVWDDVNGDGSQAGESGLQNVRVYIDEDGDNSYDAGEPTDLTDSNGNYSIGGLPAGAYDVLIDTSTLPAGYNPSYDLDGGNDDESSVTVTAGQTRADVDFGYQDQNGVIQVVKSASTSVVSSGGSVTYTYTVTNPGYVSLTSISVTDDQCATVSYQSGDANTNSTLESTEAWIYSCTMTLNATTTNVVTAEGTDPLSNVVQDTDTATVTVISSGIVKTIPASGTSESFTSGNNVAIGEIVTYEVTIDLPAGLAFDNVVVTDRMDKGLAFVDCLLVDVAGSDMTSTICPPTVSSITDAGDLVSNPANPGRQVEFAIGDIGGPIADSTLVIRYRAIVLDVIENQETTTLNNVAIWSWTGGSLSSSAPNVTIVEPDLFIDKTASLTTAAVGTPITFTLNVYHTPQSTADAFDIMVTDVLPAGLTYNNCTLTYSGLIPDNAPSDCPLSVTTLSFGWDSFPLGSTSTISFAATINGIQPTVTNTALVAWSSLPIDPGLGGVPVQLSSHNVTSTERLYDPGDPVNVYSVEDSVVINPSSVPDPDDDVTLPGFLPVTGFKPGAVITLPEQPISKQYATTDIWLEIPSLGIDMPIVGVPLTDGAWDVSWLGKQAGWLDGTAFPSWQGNSVLTGHVFLPNGRPGPFVGLNKLKWGDKVLVHANGYVYEFQVRENLTVQPDDTSVLRHEEDPWITLLTCKNYDEGTDTYSTRIAIRATLISVDEDKPKVYPSGGR